VLLLQQIGFYQLCISFIFLIHRTFGLITYIVPLLWDTVIQDQKIKRLNFVLIVDIIFYYRDKIFTIITIMARLTTLQIATFGSEGQEGIASGIRNFPVHKLALICFDSDKQRAEEFSRRIEASLVYLLQSTL
jgi:hypothetical protein